MKALEHCGADACRRISGRFAARHCEPNPAGCGRSGADLTWRPVTLYPCAVKAGDGGNLLAFGNV
jgi:hypothetical protein